MTHQIVSATSGIAVLKESLDREAPRSLASRRDMH